MVDRRRRGLEARGAPTCNRAACFALFGLQPTARPAGSVPKFSGARRILPFAIVANCRRLRARARTCANVVVVVAGARARMFVAFSGGSGDDDGGGDVRGNGRDDERAKHVALVTASAVGTHKRARRRPKFAKRIFIIAVAAG